MSRRISDDKVDPRCDCGDLRSRELSDKRERGKGEVMMLRAEVLSLVVHFGGYQLE